MSFKVHTPPNLTDKEMAERIRQVRLQDENGTLTHCSDAEEFRQLLSSLQNQA